MDCFILYLTIYLCFDKLGNNYQTLNYMHGQRFWFDTISEITLKSGLTQGYIKQKNPTLVLASKIRQPYSCCQ